MKKWIENISRKVGFTQTETKIILLLLITFLIGLIINYIKISRRSTTLLEFDYSVSDSLYNAAMGDVDTDDSTNVNKEAKKIFASKTELLDFGKAKNKFELDKKKREIKLKIININKASINELTGLPGVGHTTAENILSYRSKIGKITKAEQLLNVKGIGRSKLSRISSLIKFD
jgi:competence ComEA-like helix-hairpin-helix protein